MKHKHHNLIKKWNDDNSVKFEFAYGVGVDFIWADCDINYVIKNPDVQIRVKSVEVKKEKRWIAFNKENGNIYGTFKSCEMCNRAWPHMQKFEIEVEL